MIQLACRLNALSGRFGMSVAPTNFLNTLTVATATPLCKMLFNSEGDLATFEFQLASAADVETFLTNADENIFSAPENFLQDGNILKCSKTFAKPLAAAGWLVGCAIKARQTVDNISNLLSIVGDSRRKILIKICPEIGKMVELRMATDKLPESHAEGQHIIGRNRYSMSGEGFRAESRLIYILDDQPYIEVLNGNKQLFSAKFDLRATDNEKLALTNDIKIQPLPTTVVVERRITADPTELKYELFIEPDEEFDIKKLMMYENSISEFDPDCYDGLSVDYIIYGDEILKLLNPDRFCQSFHIRYFFGTLFPDYIEYV